MIGLQSISWSPRGPTTPPNTPALLYDVSRSASYVGLTTTYKSLPLPRAIEYNIDVSIDNFHTTRPNNPQNLSCSLPPCGYDSQMKSSRDDASPTHDIQRTKEATTKSNETFEDQLHAADERRCILRLATTSASTESGDKRITIETEANAREATLVFNADSPQQATTNGLLDSVMPSSSKVYANKVWPTSMCLSPVDAVCKDRAASMCRSPVDAVCKDRPASTGLSPVDAVCKDRPASMYLSPVDDVCKGKPTSTYLSPVDAVCKDRVMQVSAMFCVETTDDAALRRLREQEKAKTRDAAVADFLKSYRKTNCLEKVNKVGPPAADSNVVETTSKENLAHISAMLCVESQDEALVSKQEVKHNFRKRSEDEDWDMAAGDNAMKSKVKRNPVVRFCRGLKKAITGKKSMKY